MEKKNQCFGSAYKYDLLGEGKQFFFWPNAIFIIITFQMNVLHVLSFIIERVGHQVGYILVIP